MQPIPHTKFKAKVLAVCTLALFIGLILVCFFPESQQSIATMISAFLVFGGVVVGARAVQQYSHSQLTYTPTVQNVYPQSPGIQTKPQTTDMGIG